MRGIVLEAFGVGEIRFLFSCCVAWETAQPLCRLNDKLGTVPAAVASAPVCGCAILCKRPTGLHFPLHRRQHAGPGRQRLAVVAEGPAQEGAVLHTGAPARLMSLLRSSLQGRGSCYSALHIALPAVASL